MLRREFIVGSSVAAAALAVAPQALAQASTATGLWPRQESLRQRARLAEDMYLCMGQRSGKTQLAYAIYQDRLEALRTCPNPSPAGSWILVVSAAPKDHAFLWSHMGHRRDERLHPRPVTTTFETYEGFMQKRDTWQKMNIDSIFFEEVDWQNVATPSQLLEVARDIHRPYTTHSGLAPLKYMASSPSSPNSEFLNLVRSSLNAGGTSVVADHAATWEVNPTISKEDLLPLRPLFAPGRWERDFGAYRNV